MAYSKILCAILALVAVVGCGGGSSYGGSPTGPGNTGGNNNTGGSTSSSISVGDNYFSPAATTVPAGTTVTWTWAGSVNHNVTFDDGAASSTQASGTYSRTFSTAGTYAYHCTIHGASMSGTVTVH